jgi:hypothetical protein
VTIRKQLSGSSPLLPALLVVGVSIVLTCPSIVLDIETMSGLSADMNTEHLPLINYFIAHSFDILTDQSNVPTLPGYHIVLAWWCRLLGYHQIDSRTLPLRFLHSLIGIAFSLATFAFLRLLIQRGTSSDALSWNFILWLTIGPSYFVLQSTIYVSNDVPGLLIYLGLLYLEISSSRSLLARSMCNTALVLARQAYAPAIAVPFLLAPRDLLRKLLSPWIFVLLAPAAAILTFVVAWGGLVPPRTRTLLPLGFYPHSLLHIFALLGLFAPIYGFVLRHELRGALHSRHVVFTGIASLLGAWICWLIEPSSLDHAAGRWGSIVWTLGEKGPGWHNHSLVLLLLASAGAAFAAALVHVASFNRDNLVILLALALCLSLQLIVATAFQRYVEPVLLLSLSSVVARSVKLNWQSTAALLVTFGAYDLVGVGHLYKIFGTIG